MEQPHIACAIETTEPTTPDAPAYEARFGRLGDAEWSEIVRLFDDATVYQTWAYGAVHWKASQLIHAVLRRDGEIVAAAQLRALKLPLLRAGVAYLNWGPMWRRRGRDEDLDVLRAMLRASVEEFSGRRGLQLRIQPTEYDDRADIAALYESEGFRRRESPARTLILDLGPSLDALRAALRRDWRRSLKLSEAGALEVVEGAGSELIRTALALHREMHARKQFAQTFDAGEYAAIQETLADDQKLCVAIARHEGEPVAMAVWTSIGSTAVEILRASNARGREANAAFLLSWRMIQSLKDRGRARFDLGGINPERNPGSYTFKSGLAGKLGRDVRRLGVFDQPGSRLGSILMGLGDRARTAWREFRRNLSPGSRRKKAPPEQSGGGSPPSNQR